MAKSKRKRRAEIRDQKDAKKFWTVVAVATIVLVLLLFLMYRSV